MTASDHMPIPFKNNLASQGASTHESSSAVPGRDEHGNIEADALKAWITEARKVSEKAGYRTSLDYQIGELLAHAPKDDDGAWPCKAVCEAVNDMYSEELARGISIGRYNARGTHFRGEGGGQERVLAEQYETWAKACDYDFPRMASILRSRSKSYLDEADWQDNEAMIRKRLRY